jgi:hypothetical protein
MWKVKKLIKSLQAARGYVLHLNFIWDENMWHDIFLSEMAPPWFLWSFLQEIKCLVLRKCLRTSTAQHPTSNPVWIG